MRDTTKQINRRVEILQMTTTELSRFMEVSLFENPVLIQIDAQTESNEESMQRASQNVHSINEQATTMSIPELYIQKIGSDYDVGFVDDKVALIHIDQKYQRMLVNPATSSELRNAIKQKMRSAVDLLRNVEHRRTLSYEIVNVIVRHQREFLEKGVEYIKPMMLKDVSEDTGISALLISYVINGKYAQTPQGVIELRRFFVNEDPSVESHM